MIIPSEYRPKLLDDAAKEGYLSWSLDFFTNPDVIQVPYLDITLQLDVTTAYQQYQATPTTGATFFSFLTWHLLQTLKNHSNFHLRLVQDQWFILDNPPVVIPVAVAGSDRFREMVLENISYSSYPEFILQYRQKLDSIRSNRGQKITPETFLLSCFLGNLPNLQFTGLTLHSR
jgi:chloramphenicol O-acetyltransferase type A